MRYLPTFDSSTLYYAERLLFRLCNPRKKISTHLLLAAACRVPSTIANLLKIESPAFLDAFRELREEAEEFSSDLPSHKTPFELPLKKDWWQLYGPEDEFIKLLFSIAALSLLVEAIILGDNISYVGGTATYSPELSNFAPWIYHNDQKNCQLITDLLRAHSDERKEEYRTWLDGAKSSEMNEVWDMLTSLSYSCLHEPLLTLASSLNDASQGLATHPVVVDQYSPLPLTSPKEEGLLGRMQAYLHNGFCHQRICLIHERHYVWNPVRAPFLAASMLAQPNGDLDERRRIVRQVIGLEKVMDEDPSFKLVNYPVFLRLVLNSARSPYDILPAAYRLRRELTPLRQHINANGVDRALLKDIESVHTTCDFRDGQDAAKNALKFGPLSLALPLPPNSTLIRWLYHPFYPQRGYLPVIRRLRDEFSVAVEVAPRLRELHSRNSEKNAEQSAEYMSVVCNNHYFTSGFVHGS